MKLGSLFEAVINTVTLPIDAVLDIATFGRGFNDDGEGTFLQQKIDKIANNLNEFTD